MKELKFSDDGENFYDFFEIIPEQFIVTAKELDRNLYDQFFDLLRETDMPTDSSVLLRQGGELSDNTMLIFSETTCSGAACPPRHSRSLSPAATLLCST